MSFPRYPKYKDSGVEWLGEVPEHWRAVPIKHVGNLKGGAGFPHAKQGLQGEELSFHKVNALARADQSGALVPGDDSISRETAAELRAHIFPCGSIVFAKVGAALLLGRIRTLRADACIDNNMMGLMISPSAFDCAFVRYAMLLVRFDLLANPGAVPSINESQIGEFRLPFAPLAEQTAIAAFLDRETEKIDGLVAEQRRLMELLKEKRQAVISHAVTKGLNPAAPLKPSGIEWLGDVPEHWDVMPIAYRYSVQLGKMLDSSKITGNHLRPYLRVFDVQWGEINTDDLPSMDFDEAARGRFRLKPGDLLVNEGGSYPGRSAIWSGGIDECYYQKALHRLRPYRSDEDIAAFLYFLMVWAASQGVFVAGGNETTIEHLPAEKLRKYRFPFPPVSEQQEIVGFLEIEAGQFDALTAEAQRAIDLLQERRTALISAAVTGQIDVRGV